MLLKKYTEKFFAPFKKILILILFTGLFYSIFVNFNNLFSVKIIEIISDNKNIIRGINYLTGKNIILLSENDIKEKILLENSAISDLSVEKILPNKLKIHPIYAKATAIISVNAGYFILSESATILKKQKDINELLPLIKYYQKFDYLSLNVGDKLEYIDITRALFFLILLNNLNMKTDSIDINGLNMILFNLDNKKIIFTTEKEEGIQQYELEKIIKQFKIEGKDFQSLDLRFDKPIVKL